MYKQVCWWKWPTDILPWCLTDVMGMSCFKACTKRCLEIWHFLDMLRTSKLCLIWGTLYVNMSNQNLVKGQKKGDKKWPKTLAKNVGPTSPQHCQNVGPMSAQCWLVGDVGLLDKLMAGQCCKADVELTLLTTLAWCWILSGFGPTLAWPIDIILGVPERLPR